VLICACVYGLQAGDGTTTATVLSAAFVQEGMKVVAAGANPVQLTRGMDKTVKHLVKTLASLSKEVEDSELAAVASVSAGGNDEVSDRQRARERARERERGDRRLRCSNMEPQGSGT
jgi:hypothetical protein